MSASTVEYRRLPARNMLQQRVEIGLSKQANHSDLKSKILGKKVNTLDQGINQIEQIIEDVPWTGFDNDEVSSTAPEFPIGDKRLIEMSPSQATSRVRTSPLVPESGSQNLATPNSTSKFVELPIEEGIMPNPVSEENGRGLLHLVKDPASCLRIPLSTNTSILPGGLQSPGNESVFDTPRKDTPESDNIPYPPGYTGLGSSPSIDLQEGPDSLTKSLHSVSSSAAGTQSSWQTIDSQLSSSTPIGDRLPPGAHEEGQVQKGQEDDASWETIENIPTQPAKRSKKRNSNISETLKSSNFREVQEMWGDVQSINRRTDKSPAVDKERSSTASLVAQSKNREVNLDPNADHIRQSPALSPEQNREPSATPQVMDSELVTPEETKIIPQERMLSEVRGRASAIQTLSNGSLGRNKFSSAQA